MTDSRRSDAAPAACATGKATPEEAISKLESQMKRIYRRMAKRG